MTRRRAEAPAAAPPAATSEPTHPLEAFLPGDVAVSSGAASPAVAPALGLRSAVLVALEGRRARVVLRGRATPIEARVAPEVEPDLLVDALPDASVLVESDESGELLVVGLLATRRPRELRLRAGTIHVEGDDEVLIRAGRSAIRLRADGDLEVVGSRISASSRGLFKIVGRLLRLN